MGFEVDRIVLPAIEMKADMVWLLVHNNRADDAAIQFEEKIRTRLDKAGIEVKEEHADRKSLFDMLCVIRNIIENDGGKNDIYVNVSSGSKIQAIACMMACMMWNSAENLTPYYAEPEEYNSASRKQLSISSGLKDIKELPRYNIQTPREELVRALIMVKESEGGKITKSDLAQKAEDAGLITVNSREENHETAKFASLAKNIVDPLANDWKFLKIEKVGRTRWISLTEEGKGAAEFLR